MNDHVTCSSDANKRENLSNVLAAVVLPLPSSRPLSVCTFSRSRYIARYNTTPDAISTCARKRAQVSLIYRTEPTIKRWGKKKKLNSKNGYAQKYRQTVRAIRGVGPERVPYSTFLNVIYFYKRKQTVA